ncbi:multifunctional CCA addition/repair protein [Ferrimonas balearica]|uniref:multifunctional CCA addition/repair protein n=1 Tax=Ferrimonas balearica TaxID=44012 RepID=UPI001C98F44E|nr:multifunctional CCA addition/repair protein [Ferrimonas balearica]MBY5923400.1 multifunctional CCA addition/repair protein [Ferrimonas balearica]MBY5995150.1 multifunctional CCA addition/repair protein [Ferrimonas balearica]
MKIYLVGGAVRDELLGLTVKDRDHLVVGASAEQMSALGYRQVGKSFPVFLHPKSGEEYALARTERKAGHGYGGFDFDAAPTVTLEEDLIRRDLTINAMAQDEQGNIYDPYGGQADLANRLLRHVSDAFVEDPLRVLRVARFAARFHHLGFTVAEETLTLMQKLSDSGELDYLSAERVWQETERALGEPNPEIYFQVLSQCHALSHLFPELAALVGVPQPEQWHGGLDAWEHTMKALTQAVALGAGGAERFAVLVHDLGKALTPADQWPRHIGHEHAGLRPIRALCERLRVPNEWRDLALLVGEMHLNVHRARELKPATLVRLFDKLDAWRKPARFAQLLRCCQCDAQGRPGQESTPYPAADYLQAALAEANRVAVKDVVADGFSGADIREELGKRRTEVLVRWKAAQ